MLLPHAPGQIAQHQHPAHSSGPVGRQSCQGQSLSCLEHEGPPAVSHGKLAWRNLGRLLPLRYLRCALPGFSLSVKQQCVPERGKGEKRRGEPLGSIQGMLYGKHNSTGT